LNFTDNYHAHSTIPAGTKVRDQELEQQEANTVRRTETGPKAEVPLDGYSDYSEKPFELDGYGRERTSVAQVATASSSIYGAYDGPAHFHPESFTVNGHNPLMAPQTTYIQQIHVASGPAPTFNQAKYDPLAETGLGISAKSQPVKQREFMANTVNGSGGAAKDTPNGVNAFLYSTGDYATPASRGQFVS